MADRGKFIVLYGINNLGKTTQAELLVERLKKNGYKAEYLKYPIYELEPSGVMINEYLRKGNPFGLTAREVQTLYALNRTQFQPVLEKKLAEGKIVVAEDYIGTGICWGIGAGVSEQYLKKIHTHLIKEDLAFHFDGERFSESIEACHKHEQDNDLMNKVRWAHLKMGQEEKWVRINANLPIEQIHEQIWMHADRLINPLPEEIFAPASDNDEAGRSSGEILVERITPSAKLPQRAHSLDAGLDLFADDYYTIIPGARTAVRTGIKIALPEGYAGLVWDKSGLAKNNGLHCLAGVIDPGYQGEIQVIITNLGDDIYNISPGQKIAQLLIQETPSFKVREDFIGPRSERSDKGFGSSGLY